jgi:acyl-coenzyme A thioesterase PaaI-like protein
MERGHLGVTRGLNIVGPREIGTPQPNSDDGQSVAAIERDPLGDGVGGRLFADLIGLRREAAGITSLTITPALLNGAGLLVGPVGFALIDYSMASALWQHRNEGEMIATINIALNFIQSASDGDIRCLSRLDRRNRFAAALTSEVRHEDGRLLITAVGSFAIRSPAA